MKNKKWLWIGIISLIFLILLGGIAYLIWQWPNITATPVDMELHASVVSIDGKIQETIDFSAKGRIRTNRDNQVEFDGDFDASDSFRYKFRHAPDHDPYPYIHSQHPFHTEYPDHGAFTSSTFFYDKATHSSTVFDFAIDVEAECLIFRWQYNASSPYMYIVASADESKTPQELLDYFSWFL